MVLIHCKIISFALHALVLTGMRAITKVLVSGNSYCIAQDATCNLQTRTRNMARDLSTKNTHFHSFPKCGGGLLIGWARDSMSEMMVITQEPTLDFSLFMSKDGGRSWNK